MKLTKIVLFALVVGGSSCQDDEEQTRGTSSAQGGSRAMLVGTALKVTRDDIVSALEDYDTAYDADAIMAAGMDPAIRDAIATEALTALEAAESAAAKRKDEARATTLQADDAEAAVYKNALAFATVAYVEDVVVQAAITAYAKKARTLTAAVEAVDAEIDGGDAAVDRKAAAHELALHYADATAYAAAQGEMIYYSAEEATQARAAARKVVDADMNVTIAREAALEVGTAAREGEADYQASGAGFAFANAIYSLQVAYENRAMQALYEARATAKEFPQETSQILLAREAARKTGERQQAEAENFLSNGVGKKVPYELWVNGIFGAPDTLDGTDGRYWVAHLAEIDVSFVSEKSSKEVLYVGHGKSAQDYLEKKAAARKERIEKGFSSLWDGSHRELTKVIKGSMNDPGSYEHVETVSWDMGDHLVVRTTFRGKNAFGSVVSNWVKAKTDLDGNVLEVIEQGQ